MPKPKIKTGRETVLAVQSSATGRAKTARILEAEGYRVYLATSENEALEIWKAVSPEIDLLLVEVKLPSLSGIELAQVLLALNPRLKVLYTGGSDDPAIKARLTPSQRKCFLQKPFGKATLVSAIRNTLDQVP